MTPDPDPTPDPPVDPPAPVVPDPPEPKGLTAQDRANLEAVVEKERKDRRAAEKTARDAQALLDAANAEKLSDTEKAEARATAAEARLTAATEKARRANVTLALADLGLQGSRAKAAAKLLEGLEFDDDTDEPKNLDDRLKAARAEYGEDVFKGAKAPAPNINGGGSGSDEGPALEAGELEAAKSFGMTPEQYAAAKDPTYQPPARAAT